MRAKKPRPFDRWQIIEWGAIVLAFVIILSMVIG